MQYKLRDWLFSRQRYWGEPFPIVWDDDGVPVAAARRSQLPVVLPEIDDYSPKTFDPDDADTEPEPPLSRATRVGRGRPGPGDGRAALPARDEHDAAVGRLLLVLPALPGPGERRASSSTRRSSDYWLGKDPARPGDPGGVDLYVGGVEHAVLHLLYARFWHKVLYDLGHVSSEEPFRRLFNQGYIQAFAYTDARGDVRAGRGGRREPPTAPVSRGTAQPVRREYGKMGKSLRNVVTPDEMCERYGADTFRLYEMSTGPMDVSRPWSTRDVVGSQRFLQRVWRNLVDEQTGEAAGHRRRAGRRDAARAAQGRSPGCTPTSWRCTTTRRRPS